MASPTPTDPVKEVARNKKARHDFQIVETYEAGISLVGTEVKSIREGKVNIADAFARIEQGQVWLYGCDIHPYEKASHTQHAAKRPRRLLLHRREIDKLFGATQIKGQALVALRLYFRNQRLKVEIGVARGKTFGDRREDLKKREARREIDRELAHHKRR